MRVRNLVLAAALTVATFGQAHAFAPADWLNDGHITQALKNAASREGNNPRIDGFAIEELVATIASAALGRECHLSANPRDTIRDVVCPSIIGRPIQLQVKSGTSMWMAREVCKALETGRYAGARMVLADDTYANALAVCPTTIAARAQAGMLEKAGFATTRVRVVAGRMLQAPTGVWGRISARIARSAPFLHSVPYIGAAIGSGVIAWEAYEIASDSTLDTQQKIEKAGGVAGAETVEIVATGGAIWVTAALTAALVPSAPVVVPVAAGVTVAGGVGYALYATGAVDAVKTHSASATRWMINQLPRW